MALFSALLAGKIGAIRAALKGTPLFINARVDVYLKGLVPAEPRVAATPETVKKMVGLGAEVLDSVKPGQQMIKIVYDVLLLAMFQRVRPPEEAKIRTPSRESS